MQKKFQHFQQKTMKKLRPLLDFMDAMNQKSISIIAAGIAYYTLLAVFPAMAAGMAVALFVLEPAQVQAIMRDVSAFIPREIASLLSTILSRQAGETSNLWAAALGIGFALFGASGAMDSMTKALNAVFDTKETRNVVELKLLSVAFTIGAIVLAAVVAVLLILTIDQLTAWGVPGWLAIVIAVMRWIVAIVVILTALSLLFRYAVNQTNPALRFVTPGVLSATGLWLLVTVVFMVYLKVSPNLAQSYSIFAGIIALMMWFNLTATAILVGALVDARRQKSKQRSGVFAALFRS